MVPLSGCFSQSHHSFLGGAARRWILRCENSCFNTITT
ncbi:hypothetical protein CGRA01v4_01469 [Colletotrichum graminicola]|nr:hypothetical protein CGRA01v4_01469 [Colletotrichum graminicola]